MIKKKFKNSKEIIPICLNLIFSDNIYVQGNFENYEYFKEYKNELSNFFVIKKFINHKNSIVKQLSNNNSISIHIRRNRFSDQIGLTDTVKNKEKSEVFYQQIIDYINKSVSFIEKKKLKIHNILFGQTSIKILINYQID